MHPHNLKLGNVMAEQQRWRKLLKCHVVVAAFFACICCCYCCRCRCCCCCSCECWRLPVATNIIAANSIADAALVNAVGVACLCRCYSFSPNCMAPRGPLRNDFRICLFKVMGQNASATSSESKINTQTLRSSSLRCLKCHKRPSDFLQSKPRGTCSLRQQCGAVLALHIFNIFVPEKQALGKCINY